MSEFYDELDRKEHEGRIQRLIENRPANLHDYQGCVNDPNMQPLAAQRADAETPVQPEEESRGDWPEDAPHKNGNYWHTCCRCGRHFIGHKRRVECKTCANKTGALSPSPIPASQLELVPSAEELLQWLADHEANLVTHREKVAGGGWRVWWNVVKWNKSISGHPLGSPRAAIEFAMKEAAHGKRK